MEVASVENDKSVEKGASKKIACPSPKMFNFTHSGGYEKFMLWLTGKAKYGAVEEKQFRGEFCEMAKQCEIVHKLVATPQTGATTL